MVLEYATVEISDSFGQADHSDMVRCENVLNSLSLHNAASGQTALTARHNADMLNTSGRVRSTCAEAVNLISRYDSSSDAGNDLERALLDTASVQ